MTTATNSGDLPSSRRLASGQIALVAGLGVAFWISGVVAVWLATSFGLFRLAGGIAAYAAAPAFLWVMVWLAGVVGRLKPGQYVPATALATAVALALDGLALRFAPYVYGHPQAALFDGAAWLHWGGALGLAISFLFDRKAP